jgi:hypothetical protein
MPDPGLDAELLGPGLVHHYAARVRLSPPHLGAGHRALLFATLAWVPLALLTLIEGTFSGPGWVFSRDVGAYVRFLLVGPVLVAVGPAVDRRLARTIAHVRFSMLVPPERREAFDAFLVRQRALRLGPGSDAGMLAASYALTLIALLALMGALDQRWISPDGRSLTLAGWWCVLVTLPLFFHAMLRWLWRFVIWTAILVRLVTLPLRVLGTHPDCVGGLDPLTRAHHLLLFVPAGVAAMVCGNLANQVLHRGATLEALRTVEGLLVVILAILHLGPLLIFTPALLTARRRASSRYGAVAANHALYLDGEIQKALTASEPSQGRLDGDLLESEANLAQSFGTITSMRSSLVTRSSLALFALAALGPLLPLELVEVPARQLLQRLGGVLL